MKFLLTALAGFGVVAANTDGLAHIEMFKTSTEGKWMTKKKADFAAGILETGDIEFEFWKELLVTKCPWYRIVQRKVDAGELESTFPFYDQLKSGSGPAWSGEHYEQDSPFEAELKAEFKANFGHHNHNMGTHGGGYSGHKHGYGGHGTSSHGNGMDHIRKFMETEEGQWTAKVKAMYVAGELTDRDEEFQKWKDILLSKCPWYKQKEAQSQAGEIAEKFPFFSLLKSGDGPAWSGDYSTPSETWSKKDNMKAHSHGQHGGPPGHHSQMIKMFAESEEGQKLAALKAKFVAGEIKEGDSEYEEWKAALMAKCPWYAQQETMSQAGEIEDSFPFFSRLKSGSGPAWTRDYSQPEGPPTWDIAKVDWRKFGQGSGKMGGGDHDHKRHGGMIGGGNHDYKPHGATPETLKSKAMKAKKANNGKKAKKLKNKLRMRNKQKKNKQNKQIRRQSP